MSTAVVVTLVVIAASATAGLVVGIAITLCRAASLGDRMRLSALRSDRGDLADADELDRRVAQWRRELFQ